MISAAEAKKKVNSKKTLWEACVRNRYALPPCRDAFNSAEFLDKVRTRQAFLPKTDECKVAAVADPPKKEIIAIAVHDAMRNWVA